MAASVGMKDELAWATRKGRRATDTAVPNTRQVYLIAEGLRPLAEVSPEAAEAIRAILPFMSRGEDVAFVLGTDPSDTILKEGPTQPSLS